MRIAIGLLLLGLSFVTHANQLKTTQVRMIFPKSVITVGDAVDYLLEISDYKLVIDGDAPQESFNIGMEPIPSKAHRGQVLSLENSLLLLIGDERRLVVDHQHKLLSFESLNSNSDKEQSS